MDSKDDKDKAQAQRDQAARDKNQRDAGDKNQRDARAAEDARNPRDPRAPFAPGDPRPGVNPEQRDLDQVKQDQLARDRNDPASPHGQMKDQGFIPTVGNPVDVNGLVGMAMRRVGTLQEVASDVTRGSLILCLDGAGVILAAKCNAR